MMQEYLDIGRRFVGGKHPWRKIDANGIRQGFLVGEILVAESGTEGIEIFGSLDGEASKKYCASCCELLLESSAFGSQPAQHIGHVS